MKKLIFLFFLFLLLACTPQTSHIRTLQVNYTQNGESFYVLLNVKVTDNDYYEVLSQEYFTEEPPFTIYEIFNYNKQYNNESY